MNDNSRSRMGHEMKHTTIYALSEESIKNGTFYKESPVGHANTVSKYVNGDFMGFIDVARTKYVPGLIAYRLEKVKDLIPKGIL